MCQGCAADVAHIVQNTGATLKCICCHKPVTDAAAYVGRAHPTVVEKIAQLLRTHSSNVSSSSSSAPPSAEELFIRKLNGILTCPCCGQSGLQHEGGCDVVSCPLDHQFSALTGEKRMNGLVHSFHLDSFDKKIKQTTERSSFKVFMMLKTDDREAWIAYNLDELLARLERARGNATQVEQVLGLISEAGKLYPLKDMLRNEFTKEKKQ